MINIKFGTDGWRAIIAQEFTVENVTRVAYGTALWLKEQNNKATVVIGNDPRFAGKLFAETTAKVFANAGIKVFLSSTDFVSTPMVSLGTVLLKADLGVIITASHNPPAYSGYKIKAAYGGPATPSLVEEVENLIPDRVPLELLSIEEYKKKGLIEDINLEDLYIKHIEENFDLDAIRNSGMNFAYDAMYGAGQNAMRRLFPEATFLHCENNPGFDGQAPEPIHKNLQEFSEMIKLSGDIDSGLATDGDADRIGLYNAEGEFVDSHHIILLLIHYLYKYKGLNGDVITTFSCTQKIADLCRAYNLPHTITKIGFKYICDLMVNSGKKILAGGEESGGIAIAGYIPERDGIWIGLTVWEFMAKTKKSLNDLIQEIYDLVGSFAVERYDLHLTEEKKQAIITACKERKYQSFGSYNVQNVEDMDGFKFHVGNGSWVMVRPSGTEPVLRVYSEAATSDDAFSILDATKATLLA
ncbi:phosphoglucomutase/phosphomannomutase family protein [Solitalea lacus]|uniref:phosphoglucomutase/phosphomannomutase family protein n=1 Tax=Solitalea lacus TaxID=2911172 RepID=UPI001EDC60A1|nr:phosphoglucomutase/phosphomannomutase family protein [Solitalea lacus]UKJ05962.1 phosphoglucomutase/phosphomannomutase family protein [Solitalea lacus]